MALYNLSMPLFYARCNPFNQNKSGRAPLFLATKQRYEAGRAGFTMMEVIISTLIIVVLAGGLFGAFLGSKQLLNRARHKIQAYNFAMEAIDKLRSNYRYEDSAMNITPPTHTDSDIGGGIIQGEMAGLSTALTYSVTEQPNGYKEVTINVDWDEFEF